MGAHKWAPKCFTLRQSELSKAIACGFREEYSPGGQGAIEDDDDANACSRWCET